MGAVCAPVILWHVLPQRLTPAVRCARMPKLTVEKSILIDGSPEEVFRVISNFERWRSWNPWLVTEPEARVEISPGGKAYTWKGKRTGEGSLRIISETAPSAVSLDLVFLLPHKLKAEVAFRISREVDGSRVVWSMDGSLPFLRFFLKPTIINLIGMDFERGLSMLKDFVETGSVPAQLALAGEGTFGGCTYVGVTTECRMEDVGQRMSDDFIRLSAWAKETSTQLSDKALSVYHKWDLATGTCRYTSAYPVDEAPSTLPPGFEAGQVPSLRVWQIQHKGSYKHLGNAWSTGMQMARGKEFRVSKAFPPFERYVTMPGEVSEEKQEVMICFPIT